VIPPRLPGLRPLDERDLPTVERALDDAEIARWFDSRGFTAPAFLEYAVARWANDEAATFAIVDGDTSVGAIWLDLGPSGRANVAYWLLADARGRGLVTRAVLEVARWAFAELGVQRIGLLADPRNASSLAVAERAGFTREGVLRSWAEVNGERVDHVVFSLLPAELSPSG
jgi:RimJ/RimL family protein N-acetyltransferase